jgi:hypothetical protein
VDGARSCIEIISEITILICQKEALSNDRSDLASLLYEAAKALSGYQQRDGTIHSVNLASPPDTGFVVQEIGHVLRALDYYVKDPAKVMKSAIVLLEQFLRASVPALISGGVHTPNHRWVMCAALSVIYTRLGVEECLSRIDEWLSEGVDIDESGQFCEHSPGVYTRVSVESLFETAILLDRAELLGPVRSALRTILYLTHPDGRLETSGSRRQDQFRTDLTLRPYRVYFALMAAIDGDADFAAAAEWIAEVCPEPDSKDTIRTLSFHELLRDTKLVDGTTPQNYSYFFPEVHLYRHRRGQFSVSVFGGQDPPVEPLVQLSRSGMAMSPNIITAARGNASIRWVRVAPFFFGIGYLRPKLQSGDTMPLHLSVAHTVGYVQPLAAKLHIPTGSYPLTTADHRFFSAISLDAREISQLQQIEMSCTVNISDDRCRMKIESSCSSSTVMWIEIAVSTDSYVYGSALSAATGYLSPGTITLQQESDELALAFTADSPVNWTPKLSTLGDFDSVRREREMREHRRSDGAPGLRLFYAPFLTGGSAELEIR